MKRPTFLQGVVVAAVLAFAASAVISTLTPLVGPGTVIRLVIPLVSLAYLLYLLRVSSERIGKVTTFSLWSALAIVAWWVAPPLPLYVLIHVGAIWLVRSLYFYGGVFPSLFDLALSAFSVSVLAWAFSHTGSVFLATWCLFLVQALFVAIPPSMQHRLRDSDRPGNEPFDRARRQADDALRQLLSR